jgi:alkyl hydroperoxide reductase subunit AhpC
MFLRQGGSFREPGLMTWGHAVAVRSAVVAVVVADLTKQVARDYEVLIEEGGDAGVALR